MVHAPIVLMVSGGADSTYLTHAATGSELDLMDGNGPVALDCSRLTILHVNHSIRPGDAEKDEAFVRYLGEKVGVPVKVRTVDVPGIAEAEGKNLELVAREVRYAAADELLSELCDAAGVNRSEGIILTAHTLDDRVETFLMRLIDGSGTAGLRSIRPVRGRIVRPLLSHTRKTIEAELTAADREWCTDETNTDTSYLRSYVRHEVIPLLTARNGRFLENMERTMRNLERDEDYLSSVALEAYPHVTRTSQDGSLVMDASALRAFHPAVRNRIIMEAMTRSADDDIRIEAEHVGRVARAIEEGGALTLPGGVFFSADSHDARFLPGELLAEEPFTPVRIAPVASVDLGRSGTIHIGEAVRVPEGEDPEAFARRIREGGTVNGVEVEHIEVIDAGSIRELTVTPVVDGMRIQPLGMEGKSRLVSDILMEAGVPRHSRPHTPVLLDEDGGSVWVVPFRLAEAVRVGKSTQVLVSLGFCS